MPPGQVWRAPGVGKSVAPMQLHRTYGGCHGDIAALGWSADSQWVAVASKDLTARRASDRAGAEFGNRGCLGLGF